LPGANISEKEEQEIKGINIEKLYKMLNIVAHSCVHFLICDMKKVYYYFAAIQRVGLCTIVFSKQMV
jgi:hypothetical protein